MAKHIVKVFVYESRVREHEYVLGLRKILVCLLHIPFSGGMNQVKMLAMLEIKAAKMEKARQVSSRYNE